MKRNLLIVGIVVFAVLLIDQLFKIWIKTSITEIMPDGSVGYDSKPVPVFGEWFELVYIENQGMAFGTTFGSSIWAKLGLSVFRIIAIFGIGYYWFQQAKKGVRRELLVAIGLIFAGATGNLIDSMFYDFAFPYNPCLSFNHLQGSGIMADCGFLGQVETRHTGFLMGNVVDMFHFTAEWPSWVPWYDHEQFASNQIFPAIWNVADSAITIGVLMILFRQRAYFKKEPKKVNVAAASVPTEEMPAFPNEEVTNDVHITVPSSKED